MIATTPSAIAEIGSITTAVSSEPKPAQVRKRATGVVIPAERRKGQSKPAIYDLHPIVRDWLDLIRQPARELIWPWPYDRSRFYQLYRELIEAAGLPWKPRTGPQKLRRTHATYVLASGGDPTASLMHSSPDVTHRFYLDTRIVRPAPQNRQLPRFG